MPRLLLFIAAALGIAGFAVSVVAPPPIETGQPSGEQHLSVPFPAPSAPLKEEPPRLRSNYGGQAGLGVPVTLQAPETEYELAVPENSTVYAVMAQAAALTDFTFSGSEYPGLGFFVEEINGIRQDPRQNLYWVYSVNGEKATMGVSSKRIQPHDVIIWNLETEY